MVLRFVVIYRLSSSYHVYYAKGSQISFHSSPEPSRWEGVRSVYGVRGTDSVMFFLLTQLRTSGVPSNNFQWVVSPPSYGNEIPGTVWLPVKVYYEGVYKPERGDRHVHTRKWKLMFRVVTCHQTYVHGHLYLRSVHHLRTGPLPTV